MKHPDPLDNFLGLVYLAIRPNRKLMVQANLDFLGLAAETLLAIEGYGNAMDSVIWDSLRIKMSNWRLKYVSLGTNEEAQRETQMVFLACQNDSLARWLHKEGLMPENYAPQAIVQSIGEKSSASDAEVSAALNDIVLDIAEGKASDANNGGAEDQITYLLRHGISPTEIIQKVSENL